MNDRFKFRFFDKINQFMIDENSDNDKCIDLYGRDEWWWCIEKDMPTIFNYFDNNSWKEKDFVIMQCTGLKDKNGKLIYEGDIVQIPNNWDEYGMMAGEKREIYYKEGGFRLKPKWDKNSRGNWLEDTKDLEVIGNIYENEELLNE